MTRPPAPIRATAGRPLVIGHRGAPGETEGRHENQPVSFDTAFRHGAELIEFDVRLSSDGVPVVIHDADLRRTHGERISVAKQRARDLPVPTLVSTLRHFALKWPERALDVELKVHVPPERLAEAMDDAGWKGATIISSFLPRTVRAYARAGWCAGILVETRQLRRETAAAFLANTEADALVVRDPVFPAQVREAAHDAGAGLWVYTLNRDASLRKARRYRLDGVITDYPGRTLALYARQDAEAATTGTGRAQASGD